MATIPRFIIIKVTGFKIAEIFPAITALSESLPLSLISSFFSSSCFEKARITRTPSRFSLVSREILSRPFCIFLYIGTVFFITHTIISVIIGAAIRKIIDSIKSRVIDMTAAPTIRNGARTARRINIFTPFWASTVSFVIRVIRDEVPNLSISA